MSETSQAVKAFAQTAMDSRKAPPTRLMSDGSVPIMSGEIEMGNIGTEPNEASGYNRILLARMGVNPFKPGSRVLKQGTLVMNPKPEDPEQEAIYGERKYNPKVNPDSAQAIRKKNETLEEQVNIMREQIGILTAAITGTKTEEKKEPSWNEIRGQAKAAGINVKGKNKEEIIAELKKRL